jgi:hypothetical protein
MTERHRAEDYEPNPRELCTEHSGICEKHNAISKKVDDKVSFMTWIFGIAFIISMSVNGYMFGSLHSIERLLLQVAERQAGVLDRVKEIERKQSVLDVRLNIRR